MVCCIGRHFCICILVGFNLLTSKNICKYKWLWLWKSADKLHSCLPTAELEIQVSDLSKYLFLHIKKDWILNVITKRLANMYFVNNYWNTRISVWPFTRIYQLPPAYGPIDTSKGHSLMIYPFLCFQGSQHQVFTIDCGFPFLINFSLCWILGTEYSIFLHFFSRFTFQLLNAKSWFRDIFLWRLVSVKENVTLESRITWESSVWKQNIPVIS